MKGDGKRIMPETLMQRILVVRTDRIGDVALSTPVLSALRESLPSSHLVMMVAPYTRDVIEGHPALDGILVDDRNGAHRGWFGFFRLVRSIRRERFDAAIALHPTLRAAMTLLLAGVPVRVGSGYRWYSLLFNRRVYEHRKDAKRHEVEYNLSLIRRLGIETGTPAPYIAIPEQARRTVAARFEQWGIDRSDPVVVLHPGSGGSARNWPVSAFAALGDRLLEESGVKVIITGGPGDEPVVARMTERMKRRAIVAAGQLSVKELAALMAAARLLVTNSTGPLHIAAAVGTRTVALFCPITPCSPTRWGPYGEGHQTLQPDAPACPRCIETACPYYDCMDRIRVDAVYQAVHSVLDEV
jgi:heptosyltransferase-2